MQISPILFDQKKEKKKKNYQQATIDCKVTGIATIWRKLMESIIIFIARGQYWKVQEVISGYIVPRVDKLHFCTILSSIIRRWISDAITLFPFLPIPSAFLSIHPWRIRKVSMIDRHLRWRIVLLELEEFYIKRENNYYRQGSDNGDKIGVMVGE